MCFSPRISQADLSTKWLAFNRLILGPTCASALDERRRAWLASRKEAVHARRNDTDGDDSSDGTVVVAGVGPDEAVPARRIASDVGLKRQGRVGQRLRVKQGSANQALRIRVRSLVLRLKAMQVARDCFAPFRRAGFIRPWATDGKIIAERLSDKLQIIMVPTDPKFFFANDVMRSTFSGSTATQKDPPEDADTPRSTSTLRKPNGRQ